MPRLCCVICEIYNTQGTVFSSLRDSSYTEEVAEDSEGVAGAAAAQIELTALRAVKTPSWGRPLQRSRCRRYRPLLMTRAGVPDDKQDERQVAPLEEHHVNESFMRYGTLPKGAHIGAFLDSLRESGLRGSAEGGEAAAGAAGEARALRSHTEAEGVRPPASAAAAKKPSAMVRSNSSNSEFQRPRLSRLSPLVFAGAAGTGPARSRRPTGAGRRRARN
ncbi:tyrosine-protein kinase Abl-like [Amphibalanus amphitrite]|uniref:tyrosine-protein kinase Abl-like n=1 Tax=Amphibalanus amphitrite TaxID=1232801 RepID=UPI001C8FBD1C|nr:tyrosine-protein kinase Abl-like [Amphibalanus amphitrite]